MRESVLRWICPMHVPRIAGVRRSRATAAEWIERIVLGLALLGSCSSLLAQQVATAEMRLNISSQPLESALREFAAQSGVQLLFSSEGAAMGQPAPAITGFHAPREALDHLLADTGLKYEYVNSRTVAISEIRVSWRDGYVVFDDAALADVVAEFNRHNARQIFIDDPSLAALRIGGNIQSSHSDAFLWLLQNGFPITVEQTADRVVLKRR